ncbi:MAG: archease [Thermodesulfobacteriota bacterium]
MNHEEGWKLLEHTADLRIEFRGRTLGELFLHAGLGLTQELVGRSVPGGSVEISVKLDADAVEELLVDWLREVLFLHTTRGFVMTGASFSAISEHAVDAVLFGRPMERGDAGEIEVKAVTYHGISVEQGDDGYTARVVFDI